MSIVFTCLNCLLIVGQSAKVWRRSGHAEEKVREGEPQAFLCHSFAIFKTLMIENALYSSILMEMWAFHMRTRRWVLANLAMLFIVG